MLWRSSVLLALAALAAPRLAAQTIVGQVVDAVTSAPVGEGFVVLLDERGREVARGLTGVDGRFVLRAPGPGRYRLRSERIGFTAFVAPPITLEQNQQLTQRLAITEVGVELAPIVVSVRSRCRPRPDREEGTSAVWDEVRKALAASSWVAGQGHYQYTAVNYRRQWDASRTRLDLDDSDTLVGMGQTAFRSVPATQLAARGYIVREADSVAYYGPDADILQDSSFLASHCFWLVRRSWQGDRQIGLSFEPEPGGRMADVRGVLWLDERSAELRTLEFSYTRVPEGVRDSRIGGTVEFVRLPSGGWIVQRWQIRMPRLVWRTAGLIGRPERDAVLRGFRDRGGEVLQIRAADGTAVYPP